MVFSILMLLVVSQGTQALTTDYTSTCTGRKRVCNSRDNKEDFGKTCKENLLEVPEVRILSQNWKSAWYMGMIAQIILSEELEVPTIIIGAEEAPEIPDFYDKRAIVNNAATAYSWDSLVSGSANDNNDCKGKGNQCGHVLLEIWSGQSAKMNELLFKNKIERAGALGVLGQISIYVQTELLELYPSVATHRGLKDASVTRVAFPKPVTWKKYCEKVDCTVDPSQTCEGLDNINENTCLTENGCTYTPAGMVGSLDALNKEAACVATHTRAPTTEEENKYFLEGVFLGHFEEDDLGHVIAPPCDWTNFLASQILHNDLALTMAGDKSEENKTPLGQHASAAMTEIYEAAAVQRRGILLWWWEPHPLFEKFKYDGRWYRLEKVYLPPFNQDCHDDRPADSCGNTYLKAATSASGGNSTGCDHQVELLEKAVSVGLRDSLPQAHFLLSNLLVNSQDQLSMLGKSEFTADSDREAVCNWVKSNKNTGAQWQAWLPDPNLYPQSLEIIVAGDASTITIMVMCCLFILLFVCVLVGLFVKRDTPKVKEASAVLTATTAVGLILQATTPIIGAFGGVNPNSCILIPLLGHIGFSLTYLPLQFKTQRVIGLAEQKKAGAVFKTETASKTGAKATDKKKNMRRSLSRRMIAKAADVKRLMKVILAFVCVQLLAITIWLVLEPPIPLETDAIDGKVVSRVSQCSLPDMRYVFIVLDFIILGYGCLLAFSARSIDPTTPGYAATKFIGISLYNSFLISGVRTVFLISGFLDRNPGVSLVVQGVLLTLTGGMIGVLVFIPVFSRSNGIVSTKAVVPADPPSSDQYSNDQFSDSAPLSARPEPNTSGPLPTTNGLLPPLSVEPLAPIVPS